MAKKLWDLAPHYHQYPDKGCALHPSCLTCPLPKCVLDEPGIGITKAKKRTRDEEIRQRFSKGESIADLAIVFGLSQRTIQRIVKKYRAI